MKHFQKATAFAALSVAAPSNSHAEQIARVGLAPDSGAFTSFDASKGAASGATVEVLQARA